MIKTSVYIASLSAACAATSVLAQTPPRSFHEGSWVRIGGIPGGMESALLNPWMLVANSSFIAVYDGGDSSVKAFSHQGTLLWSVGRSGAGPNEFRNPSDLHVASNGRIWVLDPSNLRLTILTDAGRVERAVRVPSDIRRCAPINHAECWALTSSNDAFLARIDTIGSVLERIASPEWLTGIHAFAKEGYIATAPGAGTAVVGFLYSDRWLTLGRTGSQKREYRGLTPANFPEVVTTRQGRAIVTRVDPRVPEIVKSVAASSSRSFMLASVRNEEPSRIVDTFWLTSGAYAGSFQLPVPAHRIAVTAEGYVIATTADPYPAAHIWKFEPRTGAALELPGRQNR